MLSAYIDGELTGHEMLSMRDHLSRCRECRDEHYSLKTMKYLLSSLPEKEPRPEWVAYLAESVARPAPTMSARLRGQWERGWDTLAAALLKNIRESSTIKSPKLALALTLSAMAVFAVAVPFDHPSATTPATTATGASRASVAGWPVGSYGNAQTASTPMQRQGAMQFIAIPLPVPGPALSNTAPPIMPTAPVIRPAAPVYSSSLTNVDDLREVPAPQPINGFNSSWPGARIPIAPNVGH